MAVVIRLRDRHPNVSFLLHERGLEKARTRYKARVLDKRLITIATKLVTSYSLTAINRSVYIWCVKDNDRAKITLIGPHTLQPGNQLRLGEPSVSPYQQLSVSLLAS